MGRKKRIEGFGRFQGYHEKTKGGHRDKKQWARKAEERIEKLNELGFVWKVR